MSERQAERVTFRLCNRCHTLWVAVDGDPISSTNELTALLTPEECERTGKILRGEVLT